MTNYKQYKNIIVEEKNDILTISLNRPEVHNAMNEEMIKELTNVFYTIKINSSLRCVILRGKGKSFCAGADLNYMKSIAKFGFDENEKDGQKLSALFESIYRCPIPTLAVAHGVAFGGANGLLAACDIVIAEENTKFAFSEVKLGIAPATISPFVIKKIGEFGAKELMLTGKRFSGKEAEKWHLINYALPINLLEEKINSIIKEFQTAAPEAVKATKHLIYETVNSNNWKTLTNYTAKLIAKLRASTEGQEGMKAFFEKRKPKWIK